MIKGRMTNAIISQCQNEQMSEWANLIISKCDNERMSE